MFASLPLLGPGVSVQGSITFAHTLSSTSSFLQFYHSLKILLHRRATQQSSVVSEGKEKQRRPKEQLPQAKPMSQGDGQVWYYKRQVNILFLHTPSPEKCLVRIDYKLFCTKIPAWKWQLFFFRISIWSHLSAKSRLWIICKHRDTGTLSKFRTEKTSGRVEKRTGAGRCRFRSQKPQNVTRLFWRNFVWAKVKMSYF